MKLLQRLQNFIWKKRREKAGFKPAFLERERLDEYRAFVPTARRGQQNRHRALMKILRIIETYPQLQTLLRTAGRSREYIIELYPHQPDDVLVAVFAADPITELSFTTGTHAITGHAFTATRVILIQGTPKSSYNRHGSSHETRVGMRRSYHPQRPLFIFLCPEVLSKDIHHQFSEPPRKERWNRW